jgi:hypothetical protein
MLPFSLYATAGILTTVHLYLLLVFAAYAPAANLLEWVALAGSLCLLSAAGISLFKPRAAARVALIACLLLWTFYAPATVKTLQTKVLRHRVVTEHPISAEH